MRNAAAAGGYPPTAPRTGDAEHERKGGTRFEGLSFQMAKPSVPWNREQTDSLVQGITEARARYQDLAIYMQPSRKPRFYRAFCVWECKCRVSFRRESRACGHGSALIGRSP
jgi:hypothetical protein